MQMYLCNLFQILTFFCDHNNAVVRTSHQADHQLGESLQARTVQAHVNHLNHTTQAISLNLKSYYYSYKYAMPPPYLSQIHSIELFHEVLLLNSY